MSKAIYVYKAYIHALATYWPDATNTYVATYVAI